MNPASESRFGCFGCAWLGALMSGSLVLAGTLIWLSPTWLERLMPWKEPVLTDRVVLLPAEEDDLADIPEPPPRATEGPLFWHEQTVSTDYTTTQGATLTTIEGAEFSFPPGAIDRDVKVEAVPLIDLPAEDMPANSVPLTGLHDLRIDGQDHWQFDRPVTITMPYVPEVVESLPAGSKPEIVAWTGERWDRLPTRVDVSRGVLTAETDHASVIGGIAIFVTAVGGTSLKFTQTGQGLWMCMTKHLDHTYKTTNFAIHYDTSGKHAVVADADYPLTRGRPSWTHPLYVTDLANHLEETRAELSKVGMTVSEAGLGTRWDVFLLDLPTFGKAAIGGPIILDRELKIPNRRGGEDEEIFPPADQYRYLMRKTCAHELMHVAQDVYYNWTNSKAAKSWTEMSAEYQAVRLLELMGEPDRMPHYYIQDEPGLLGISMHRADDTDGTQEYAYAEFLQWLEKTHNADTKYFIHRVNKTADPNLQNINSMLLESSINGSLQDLFLEFAEAMHHSNLWQAKVVPQDVSKAWWRQAGTMFGRLSWRSANKAEATINPYQSEAVQLPSLTTSVFHLRADVLPPARQAKLVVGVESPKEMVDHRIGYAQYYQMVEPPLQGKVPPITWTNLPAGSFNAVLDQRVASPGVETTDSNRATLFFANTSLSKDGPPISVARWVLMAPEYIQYQRFQSGRYQIVWHKAELKDDKDRDGRSAFAGYNVYAKRVSDNEFPPNPINAEPVTEEVYFDDTDGPQLWEYTTTVVDIYGNESEPAVFKLEGDPFEGIWEGRTRLIRGSVSEPIIRTIRSEIASNVAPGEHSAQINNLINKAGVMLKNLDLLLRFGVSMTWEIKHDKGNLYTVTPRTVLGRPVEDPESGEMIRVGAFALAPRADGKTFTKGTIQLYRENEIRQTFEGTYNDPDIGSGTIGVRLAFTRRTEPALDSHEVKH